MKKIKIISTSFTITALAVCMIMQTSCRKNLLDQAATEQPSPATFWLTEADATSAMYGLYAAVRPCFDRDYYMDGQAEFFRNRGNATVAGDLRQGDAYNGGNYNPTGYGSSFDKMYQYLFGGVDRANYVIANVTQMQGKTANFGSSTILSTIQGEARLLRALCYFKLISMWGDVPYYTFSPSDNSQVSTLARVPIGQVKDSILADLTYAINTLPAYSTATTVLPVGRMSKVAALALRGKVNLYWGSWNKNGWPELEGFAPSTATATAAFTAAAADFKTVIQSPLIALFRNGAPGVPGTLGKNDALPNYFYLFVPKASDGGTASTSSLNTENLLYFTHGGTGTSQGEELMRDFSGRSHEGSQCWVSPRYEIADRYQSTITGDFVTPLIPMNPTTNPAARTTLNSAVNPNSYLNRDYRMKSTIMWDYEVSNGATGTVSTGICPFIYASWNAPITINGVNYITYNTDGCNSGYVFRKFLRDYAGQGRSDGDFSWPVIRLADVYLMYAEATNEVGGPQADAIGYVNAIRARGGLPALGPTKITDKATFFSAIEQERIVELIGEGQRSYDLRRWRAIERVWGPPGSAGLFRIDTWGAQPSRYFQNTNELEYKQDYIFRIPPGERDRNPNLTQNIPWR